MEASDGRPIRSSREALRRGFAGSLLSIGRPWRTGTACGGCCGLWVTAVPWCWYRTYWCGRITSRRGIGTALMQAALERFRSVRQVQLLTDDTEKTKGFYRSLGLLTLPELGCCGFMRP